jgi:hypothetical protein
MLIFEDSTVTAKNRIAIKLLFIYFNLYLSVMMDSLMFIYIHILSYYKLFLYFNLYLSVMMDSLMFIYIHILSY